MKFHTKLSAFALASLMAAPSMATDQHDDLIKMAAQMTEMADICQHYPPAQLAKMRANQRSETLKLGVSPARYDSVYKTNADLIRARMSGAPAAKRKSACDQMKAMAAVKP